MLSTLHSVNISWTQILSFKDNYRTALRLFRSSSFWAVTAGWLRVFCWEYVGWGWRVGHVMTDGRVNSMTIKLCQQMKWKRELLKYISSQCSSLTSFVYSIYWKKVFLSEAQISPNSTSWGAYIRMEPKPDGLTLKKYLLKISAEWLVCVVLLLKDWIGWTHRKSQFFFLVKKKSISFEDNCSFHQKQCTDLYLLNKSLNPFFP